MKDRAAAADSAIGDGGRRSGDGGLRPGDGGRTEAQRRADRVRAFRAELDTLAEAGIVSLTAEQDAAIRAHHEALLRDLAQRYDIDRTAAASELSLGMRLLSLAAGMALTAAISSLVSRYWGGFDLPLQATLLMLFPVISLAGVELAARRERTLYIASLFAIAAYGAFWNAIGVLSWTLNFPLTPSAIWAGVLFGLALALAYGFRIVLAVALLALTVALAATAFSAAGIPWTALVERPEPLAVAGFSVVLLSGRLAAIERGFGPVARLVGFSMGLISLLVLSVAGQTTLLPVRAQIAEGVYQAVMLAACLGVLFFAIRRHWPDTVKLAGAMLALFLLTRYVDWLWALLPRYVFFLALAALSIGALVALRRVRQRLA